MRHLDPQALKRLVERGLRVRSGPQSYIATCPRCHKKDRLYIRKRDGRYRCMKCGPDFEGYDTDLPLHELSGIDRGELQDILFGGRIAGTVEAIHVDWHDYWGEFGAEDEVGLDSEPTEILWSPDIINMDDPRAQRGVEYLSKRGVNLETAVRYGLRFNKAESRVIFPVEQEGILKGWQGRYTGQTDFFNEETMTRFVIPKVLTVGNIGGRALMYQDRLKGSAHCVMTEGPFDCLMADLCGGNVATMGKGVSRKQMEIIAQSGVKKLYVGLDPDAPEDIERVVKEMSERGLECYRLEPPKGYADLGASTPEAVLEAFRAAKRARPGQIYVYFKNPKWA